MMQIWTATGENDADMYSYWIDWCRYGQLMDILMHVRTVSGETDAGMDSYWID